MEPIKTFPATEKIRWINSFASKTRVILSALKKFKNARDRCRAYPIVVARMNMIILLIVFKKYKVDDLQIITVCKEVSPVTWSLVTFFKIIIRFLFASVHSQNRLDLPKMS